MSELVPPLAPPRPVRLPDSAERTLPSGLLLAAVRRRGVPMVEMRMRAPLVTRTVRERARGEVLAETLLAGTTGSAGMGKVELAAAIQALGASLGVSVDEDALRVSGSTLSHRLGDLLTLTADVLTGPSFPATEVSGEAARLAERIQIALSQAGVAAGEALGRRLYGTHPYGLGLPDPGEVRAVSDADVRSLFRDRVGSRGSVLLLVGDREPAELLDVAEAALAAWVGAESAGSPPEAPPPVPSDSPLLLVDRAGSVQSAIRLGGVSLRRTDPDYAAFQLANLVFGGYFSSRLVTNLREDKGYTYSPHSLLTHHLAGSQLTIEADVATGVTAPALAETRLELQRIAAEPVSQAELDDAREYAIGSLALGTASHASLASTLSSLLASGVGIEFLAEHPQRLRAVTVDQVHEQAARLLDPARFVTVVVGDAAAVAGPLAELGAVETG